MTRSTILEETSRSIVEAQLLLDSDPKAAADLLLRAWGGAMRLSYPPRKVSDVAELALRCVRGEGA